MLQTDSVTDLTKLLFEKFAGPKINPESNGNPNAVSGQFGRWSFFSLASAILNNSWTVLCTLLTMGVHPGTVSQPEISKAEVFFSGILLASTSYNPVMLATLLAFGASVHIRIPAPDCRTALHLACGEYFSAKSGWDKDDDKLSFIQHWKFDRTDIPQPILRHLQKFMIWILLDCEHQVETPDYDGLTPLAYTLQHSSDLTAAVYLLEQKNPADIDAPDFSGHTPLHRAIENNNLERLEFILKHRADVNAQNFMGQTSLCKAVKQGDITLCKRLLLAGANIQARDANGQNCFHLALWHSQMEILQLFEMVLLAYSRNAFERTVLDRDCRGWSSLHTCILKSSTDSELVHLFERWITSIADLDLDSQDALGWTLLHMAISSNHACARVLLEHGASVDVKDTILGWTPLHHACNEGNQESWNLLLAYQADFFLRDDFMGWTPMNLLEQAVDVLRLESGETWLDEEGNPVEDGEDEVWHDEADGSEDEDEAQPLDPVAREELARKRANLRSRITKFFAEESMRRMVRPVRQADYDREIDIARASAFPEHLYLEEASAEVDGPLRIWNSRNLPRVSFVDHQGVVRRSVWTSPAACSTLQPCRVWVIDIHGTVHGLSGLD
jgi:ankyrin repeat protein